MAYSDKVLDHYENPRNVGKMDSSKSSVGTGMVGAPACGDVMRLQIEVDEGIIVDAKFKTYGCGSAIASSSLLTEWVKGMSIDDADNIKNVAADNIAPKSRMRITPNLILRMPPAKPPMSVIIKPKPFEVKPISSFVNPNSV